MSKQLALLVSFCVAVLGCGESVISGLTLITNSPEPAGANCPNGGTRFDTGPDTNGDGTLDAEEILSTTYSCSGANGTGAQSLVTTTPEPAGANCVFGGQRVDYGVDDDSNGTLAPTEIDGTTYVCNGVDGGQSTLVVTTAEPAGANCAAGGTRIDHGRDDNSDGVLATSEIDGTTFVCNGTNGLQNLVTTTPVGNGSSCGAGGSQVDFGIDDNSDGVLDAAEIDGTFFVCNGHQALVTIVPEAAGINCASAGSRIDVGLDDDADGILDPAEVDGTSFVCNGVNGVNGHDTLVRTTVEPAGVNCAAGGTRVDQGLDDNADGALGASEIDSTSFVCNGTNGLQSLVTASGEAPGANCIAGGTRIDAGTDTDASGVLDASEITSTSFACDGLKTLVSSTPEAAGANCAAGGIRLDMGLDLNNDNALQAGEVSTVGFVCTGASGVTALVNQTTEDPGANCANGGIRVDSGLDLNINGVLNVTEIASTSFVCNGTNGSNGTNGTNGLKSLVVVVPEPAGANCAGGGASVKAGLDANDNDILDVAEAGIPSFVCNGVNGTNGRQSLVKTTAEAPGANCAAGGTKIDQGLDDNANNVLEAGEIDSTAFVCNGTNGTNGQTSLVTTTAEPAGANCIAGGSRIRGGLDTNANNVLDVAEVTSTSFACSGLKSLVASAPEAAGANCAGGGVKLSMGLDLNNDNALQAGEVTTIGFACNGANGTSGTNGLVALINQANEAPGANCANGGTLVTSGLDANLNNVLDAGEVANTSFICNGANGSNNTSFGLFGIDSSSNGAPGNLYSINATTGVATVIAPLAESFGAIDFDAAGVLYGVSRSNGNLKIIDTTTGGLTTVGATGSDRYSDLSFDSTTGTMFGAERNLGLRTINLSTGASTGIAGGSLCATALAAREDGTLFEYIGCSGQVGSVNKTTGAFTFIRNTNRLFQAMTFVNGTLFAVAGRENCTNGGCPKSLVTYDMNTGATTTIGAGGQLGNRMDAMAAGTGGSSGANGLTSLVVVAAEPAGANCAAGGSRITAGVDTNSNNVLDAGEVTSTGFACNGINGSSSFGMFGADSSGGIPGNLYSIDTTTGVSTVIAPLAEPFSAIDFDGSGVLYGISNSAQVLRIINTTTGALTSIGGPPIGRFSDMSFDATTGTMFAIRGNGAGGQLFTVNLTSGASTLVGGGGNCVAGLAVRADGTMFMDNECQGGFGTVNKANGAFAVTLPFNEFMAMTFVNGTLFAVPRNLPSGPCGGPGCPARSLVTYDVNTGVKTTVGAGGGLSGRMDALAGR